MNGLRMRQNGIFAQRLGQSLDQLARSIQAALADTFVCTGCGTRVVRYHHDDDAPCCEGPCEHEADRAAFWDYPICFSCANAPCSHGVTGGQFCPACETDALTVARDVH